MRSPQIRSTFIDFFTDRGHRLVPSGSLIPNDPTLLLTNAGMVQFKPYFLGDAVPPYLRATSLQKCARTVDIDNVGRTTRHATFFEMLGNFSFGDYFKADAIKWAWELVTEQFSLERDRLWATVYEDDDEAVSLWRKVGVPPDRIQRMGKADNFWSMGAPGPCGPCSEIFYDRGPAYGRDGGPAANGERYLEIWNLVFMQYVRGEGSGKDDYPVLGELPTKCIDTGMGVDRMAIVLQGVDNVCETDLLAPVLRQVQELSGRDCHESLRTRLSCQVVTEHARSASFLISDGVLPSNEGRGYVLRRLLRRAIRHVRLLGIDDVAMPILTARVVDNLGAAWPELEAARSLIHRVVTSEEEAFSRALRQGSALLTSAIADARSAGAGVLTGDAAFRLHDTFGFPFELTLEAAEDAGLHVDHDRFAALMDAQRHRAKQAGKQAAGSQRTIEAYRGLAARFGPTAFVGYEQVSGAGRILGLLAGGDELTTASEGDAVELILDRSPFYAQAGGQVGDTGRFSTPSGARLEVIDTRPGLEGLHVHTARVVAGEVRVGQEGLSEVDEARRAAVARSHTATHVLHWALRQTLGDHARQQGSRVDAGRLRFDFAHFSPVPAEQLARVESMVNEYLLADPEVRVWSTTQAEAEAAGATALFGERYGEIVRVVDVGEDSRELCGGTHVGHGAQAGPVRILGEASIGASLRRVEALTGLDALRHADHERALLTEIAGLLGTQPDDTPTLLRRKLAALASAERELERLQQAELEARAADLSARAVPAHGAWLVIDQIPDANPDELRRMATAIRDRRPGPGLVVLGSAGNGKAALVAALTADLVQRGITARDVLLPAAKIVEGGAGGKGDMATAGGRDPGKLTEALYAVNAEARRRLSDARG